MNFSYLALLLIVCAIVTIPYAFIIAIATWALENGHVSGWVLIIPLILLAFTVHPLWHRVQCFVDKLFYGKKGGRNTASVYAPLESAATSETREKIAAYPKASRLSYVNTILALAAALDAKDPYTYGHSQKVATYAVMLGEAIGIEPERLSALRTAALLHDIGKIGIPDKLLLKPERFNDDEKLAMQKHATLAAGILKHIPSLSNLLPHIIHHHERFDGKGYPDGIKGDDITLESRILAIADSYDAMTSLRPYRPAFGWREAVTELRKCTGTQFDPELVNVFCEIVGQNGLAVMLTPERIV